MALQAKVVGGEYLNATINTNWKGELALTGQPFKRAPNLTAEKVAAWEEVFPESRGGAAGAISKMGQAVSRATLPGVAGKAASAAVESAVDSMGTHHTVRVDWVDGKQSLIELSDKLFQHLAILLKDCRIESAPPAAPEPAPPPPGVIEQLTQLAGAVRAEPAEVTDQIAKFAALRDQGALTEEEFAAKKAELLGLSAPSAVSALVPAPPPASPPAWAPDPHGRYELRYWDGTAWTEHVSRGGVQATDPV